MDLEMVFKQDGRLQAVTPSADRMLDKLINAWLFALHCIVLYVRTLHHFSFCADSWGNYGGMPACEM